MAHGVGRGGRVRQGRAGGPLCRGAAAGAAARAERCGPACMLPHGPSPGRRGGRQRSHNLKGKEAQGDVDDDNVQVGRHEGGLREGGGRAAALQQGGSAQRAGGQGRRGGAARRCAPAGSAWLTLRPPCAVYMMTPAGISTAAAYKFMSAWEGRPEPRHAASVAGQLERRGGRACTRRAMRRRRTAGLAGNCKCTCARSGRLTGEGLHDRGAAQDEHGTNDHVGQQRKRQEDLWVVCNWGEGVGVGWAPVG